MKKYYYAKDITCPNCEGVGHVNHSDWGIPEYPIEYIEDQIETGNIVQYEYWETKRDEYYEYHHCYVCEGTGYITNEVDKATGYTIIELPVEKPKVSNPSNEFNCQADVDLVIAEYYGIIEYETMGKVNETDYLFRTEDWDYCYRIEKACDVNLREAKLLYPKSFIFKGVVCHAVSTYTMRREGNR